jgi:hypothetical protein
MTLVRVLAPVEYPVTVDDVARRWRVTAEYAAIALSRQERRAA